MKEIRKPFSLMVQETEQKVVDVFNNSQLPAYVLKTILQGLYQQVENIETQEIAKYKEEQEKLSQEKEKESDK